MLQQMATGWVEDFAAVPGTTSPNASFGIVTLADGGWEGNPADAGAIAFDINLTSLAAANTVAAVPYCVVYITLRNTVGTSC